MVSFSFAERAEAFTCVYKGGNLVKDLKSWKQMGTFSWEIKGNKRQDSRANSQTF